MQITRSHGLGNDYLVLDSGEPLSPALVGALCDRHTGVGGDGVLEPVPAVRGDYGLRIWNPDGSQAERSGNGLRIFARWLVDHRGAPPAFTIETVAGVVRCEVDDDGVTVHMGRAGFSPAQVPVVRALRDSPLQVDGATLRVTAVGVGNPHCVAFFEEPLDALPWRRWGAQIEQSPLFPNHTNVQFARVIDPHTVEARVWERGVGETRSSGTSACAVASAAALTERMNGAICVRMPGGDLHVEVGADFSLILRGPVEEIARVEVRAPRLWFRSQAQD